MNSYLKGYFNHWIKNEREIGEIMVLHENYQLNNGLLIPKIALGTWQVSQENVKPAVKSAIESGYRHIDTATAYENERGVGDAVRESGVLVEEIFITSKVPAEFKTYEKAKASIGNSLALLGSRLDADPCAKTVDSDAYAFSPTLL